MNELNGTRVLLSTNLRRDKLLLPICVATFAGVAGSSAAATAGLYPDAASRNPAAELLNATPALVAMFGRVYEPSLGAIGLIKLTGLGTAMVGLFALLVVIRHTRADEETGRAELIDSTMVGRYASLTAALLLSFGASLLTGLIGAAGLLGTSVPATGSLAFGAALACSGLVFTAIAAVAAQLSTGARFARGVAFTMLGAAFTLRAAGDAGSGDAAATLAGHRRLLRTCLCSRLCPTA